MPKTRINCPNCRQPIVAEINQLFDVGVNPQAKQLLLTGAFNIVQCPLCGYQGNASSPIVYHDPEKELLLSFFPPELGLPLNEQERIIGPLINQVVNNLPQEKRKGYLFRPQTMLTMQHLVERILEADGITREMIQEQQKRLQLIQRLVDTSEDVLAEVAKNEDTLIDADFFNLLNRLAEVAMMGGDRDSATKLSDLQKKLLTLTTFGRQIQDQSKEVEAAVQTLRDTGKELTREKLIDLLLEAPTETRLSVLVSLTRSGLDYSFFQMLSERIDQEKGEAQKKLISLREKVLDLTRQIDQEMANRTAKAGELLEAVLKADDIGEAARQNLGAMDDFFLHRLDDAMEDARKRGDLDRISRLQKIVDVIQEASAPPKEMALIEELLNITDEKELLASLEAHRSELTSEFIDALSSVLAQAESEGNKEFLENIQKVYSLALRTAMKANL